MAKSAGQNHDRLIAVCDPGYDIRYVRNDISGRGSSSKIMRTMIG